MKNEKNKNKKEVTKVQDIDNNNIDNWKSIGHRTVVKKGEKQGGILSGDLLD